MRVYRMKYNMPIKGGELGYHLTVEWFPSQAAASRRRDILRKGTGKRLAFEVDRFNAPTSRDGLPEFLTNPEPFEDNEPATPLTLG